MKLNQRQKDYLNALNLMINSLCVNKENVNNFISADEFKVFLWDINFDGREIYAPIDE